MMHDSLFLINTCSSFFMMGLIWFVQLVHYPSFHKFDPQSFPDFHNDHVFRTGLVVVPVMLVELGSSLVLSFMESPVALLNRTGLALVAAIWLSTFLLQAPTHRKLQQGYDKALIEKLVKSNWLRTVLWTVKALLSFFGYCYFLLKWGN